MGFRIVDRDVTPEGEPEGNSESESDFKKELLLREGAERWSKAKGEGSPELVEEFMRRHARMKNLMPEEWRAAAVAEEIERHLRRNIASGIRLQGLVSVQSLNKLL